MRASSERFAVTASAAGPRNGRCAGLIVRAPSGMAGATNSIVVRAKGSVDDVPFEESVSVPYSEPMTAIALRQTAEFQGAIVEAFRVLGERIHGRIAARR